MYQNYNNNGYYQPVIQYNQPVNPSKIEKKDIMLHSNLVGACMMTILLLEVISTLIFTGIIALVRGIDFAQASSLLMDDVVIGYSFNTITCFLAFVVPFALITLILKRNLYNVCGFSKPKSLNLCVFCFGAAMLMIIAGTFLTSSFSNITKSLFGLEPVQGEYGDGTYTVFSWLFMFLNVAIAPALVEEFAFRGVVFGLFKKFGDLPAIFISSILFALMHGNFVQIPYTFCLGVAMAATRAITGSIWPSVFIHFFNNAFVCIFEILPEPSLVAVDIIFTLCCIVFGILGIIMLVKKDGFKNIKDVPSTMTMSQRFLRMIGSPAMIVAIVFLLIEALSMFQSV